MFVFTQEDDNKIEKIIKKYPIKYPITTARNIPISRVDKLNLTAVKMCISITP